MVNSCIRGKYIYMYWYSVVVVAVVFTLTDRASTIPSNIRGCQSGTWSQRGTKVNGSHHGDNPLLRPTGIQIATKSYATLQAMAPTNSKTVHQTSFTPYREQPRSTRYCCLYWFVYQVPVYFLFGGMYIRARFTAVNAYMCNYSGMYVELVYMYDHHNWARLPILLAVS